MAASTHRSFQVWEGGGELQRRARAAALLRYGSSGGYGPR